MEAAEYCDVKSPTLSNAIINQRPSDVSKYSAAFKLENPLMFKKKSSLMIDKQELELQN